MFTRRFRFVLLAVAVAAVAIGSLVIYARWSFPIDLSKHAVAASTASTCQVIDYDFDGDEDILVLDLRTPDMYMQLLTEEMAVIAQYDLDVGDSSSILTWADIDADSVLEVGISHLVQDSFVLQFFDLEGDSIQPNKRISFPQGNPLDDGRWDGYYYAKGSIDANDDGVNDVIFQTHTNYDFQPRKLIAYDVIGDSVIWEYGFGAAVTNPAIGDFDGDGYPDLLLGSFAYDNGNSEVVNGTDDLHSYVIMLDRHGELIYREEMGGLFSWCTALATPWENDSTPNIFIVVSPSNIDKASTEDSLAYSQGRLLAISGRTKKILRARNLGDHAYTWQQVFYQDLGWSPEHGILTWARDGRLRIYNTDLALLRKSPVYVVPQFLEAADTDGDGIPELLLQTFPNEYRVLNTYLQELALYNTGASDAYSGFLHHRDSDKSTRMVLVAGRVRTVEIPNLAPLWLAAIYWHLAQYPFLTTAVILCLLLGLPGIVWIRQNSFSNKILMSASEAVTEAGSGIIGVDNQQRLVYANRTAQELFGLDGKWQQKKLIQLLPIGEAEKLTSRMNEPAAGSDIRENPLIPIRLVDGLKLLSIEQAGQFRSLGETIRLFLIISKHKRSTIEMLTEWHGQVDSIAHKMKGRLGLVNAAIKESLNGLRPNSSSDTKHGLTELDIADASLRHSIDLAAGLTRFRLQETELSQCDLEEALLEAADYALLPMSKSVECRVVCLPPGIRIETDRQYFVELFELLIQNAAEAVDPENGEIIIEAKAAPNLHNHETIDDYVVTVEDNGCGISSEKLSEVFRPLISTKEESGGTGLGLTIAKNRADILGAHIAISSVFGTGTTATVTFGEGCELR